jgi:hypothetical protein
MAFGKLVSCFGGTMETQAKDRTVARDDVPVKLDAEMVRKAKHVVIDRRATEKGLTLAEYLSSLLKPLVESDYDARFNQPKRPKGGAK